MPTYPINFPSVVGVTSEKLTLSRKQIAMTSPFTGANQVVDQYSQWQLQWAWPRMSVTNGEAVAAWLDSLQGQNGYFTYYPARSGDALLTSRTLNGAHYAYANVISVAGWTADATSRLRAGQWFAIGQQLFRITVAPANADSSGRCTIEFEPPLRGNCPTGTDVNFTAPKGFFRLASADNTGFQIDPDFYPEFGPQTALEVI